MSLTVILFALCGLFIAVLVHACVAGFSLSLKRPDSHRH